MHQLSPWILAKPCFLDPFKARLSQPGFFLSATRAHDTNAGYRANAMANHQPALRMPVARGSVGTSGESAHRVGEALGFCCQRSQSDG